MVDLDLILMVGCSYSGKSTWAEKFSKENNIIHLSSDRNRAILGGDEGNQAVSAEAFKLLRKDTEESLRSGKSVIVDATFRNPQSRKDFVDLGRKYRATITAVCMDVPIEIARLRAETRARQVPDSVLINQYKTLSFPVIGEVDVVLFKKSYTQEELIKAKVKFSTQNSSEKKRGWIGFDFDRTISVRNSGDSLLVLGKPIVKLIEKIKEYQKNGRKVKILTARDESQFPLIISWLAEQGIIGVEVTNKKDKRMDIFFDDKAVGVIENLGVTHIEMLDKAKYLIDKYACQCHFSEEIQEWKSNYEQIKNII